jgi:hypothetical protein
MWNEKTREKAGGVITTIQEARNQPHGSPWFICPYCEESAEFDTLRSVQPRKVKREHFEEDEGLFSV